MNVQIPDLSSSQRETLEKYLPLLLAAGVAWLALRGARKIFWSLFGVFWALRFSGIWHWL